MCFKLFKKNIKEECFICCSFDGKNDDEIKMELYGQKYLNYPLLSLSKAYNCNCHNSYAHNKCLLNINKCPTCRKYITKPNLYVNTRYDYYLYYLFEWIKKDISRIEKIKWLAITYFIFICFMLNLFENNKKIVRVILPPNSIISIMFSTTITSLCSLSVYTIVLNDYFNKYWLYNSKTNKCYVF